MTNGLDDDLNRLTNLEEAIGHFKEELMDLKSSLRSEGNEKDLEKLMIVFVRLSLGYQKKAVI